MSYTSTKKQTTRRSAIDGAGRLSILIFGMAIAPTLLLVQTWRTNSNRYRHWLLIAFFTIYGATIGIAYDPTGEGSDGVRHLLKVYTHYVDLPFGAFLVELRDILTFRVGTAPNKDVYIHVVSYIVGGLLNAPGLFFAVIGLVYGYFFAGSMLIIFRDLGSSRLPFVTLFLVANFFLVVNIEGVNTVRTWTGLWVLLYACLKYFETKKFLYLLLMAMPPFIHIGYFIMALPAYAVVVLRARIYLFSMLLAVSALYSATNLNAIPQGVVSLLSQTERGEAQVDSYFRDERLNSDTILSNWEGSRIWLVLAKLGIHKWALYVFVLSLLLSGVLAQRMNLLEQHLVSVGMLCLTLSNFLWFIFALSNRSWPIGAVFIGASFIMMRLRWGRKFSIPEFKGFFKFGMCISAILFVPFFFYNLSKLLDFPSVYLLVFPFVVWVDPSLNMTIKEALQYFIFSVI